ncbi:MAG: hypothetical protein WCO63_00805 [Bacteroidota bacterium]
MKKVAIIIVVCFCSLVSYAQLEMYGRYIIDGKVEPSFNIYGEKKISSTVNLTYFVVVEEKWSEALIGLSYAPVKWMILGLSTGIENNPSLYRFGASLWLGKNKTSFVLLGEKGDGKDNYWYKICLAYKASEQFTFSAMAWRYQGIGPLISYMPKKSDLTIWFMPAYDPEIEAKMMMLGINVKI